jgi:hypothetical protein
VNAETHGPSYPDLSSGAPFELRDAVMVHGRTPDDDPSPEQIEIYRRMSGARRLEMAEQMFWFARKFKAAGVRHQHPDWPEEKVTSEVNRIFLHVRD